MKFRRMLLLAATPVAAIGIGAGVSFAVWSVSGSGSGGAAATVAQGVTLTATTPSGTSATLYPGGPASAVYFTVSNPNPYAVTITGVTWGTPVSFNTSSCASSNISLSGTAPTTGLSISVPANSTAAAGSIPGVLVLSHAAPDGCQGNAFGIGMTVTGVQQ